MREEWREVRPGIEVSSLGRVRQYVTGHLNGDGYPCVSNGKRGAGRVGIHVLLAEAFIGPRPPGHVVRHLDDNRLNNRLDNIAYGTRSENVADAIRNGRAVLRPPTAEACSAGGRWWAGKKRAGLRGKAVSP